MFKTKVTIKKKKTLIFYKLSTSPFPYRKAIGSSILTLGWAQHNTRISPIVKVRVKKLHYPTKY